MNRKLFELQEIDNQIAKFMRERSRLDDGSTLRSERDTLQKARDVEQERLNTLNKQRADKELELKATEDKIARQQQRLMNATSAHEVTSLERDIKALSHARGDLDEAILNLMDEAETSAARLAELEKEFQEKSAETTEAEKTFAGQTTRLENQLAVAKAKREQLVPQIEADDLAMYTRIAKAHQGVAVAHPDKGNCSACGMALTSFNLREAKSQEWPTCENCNRLLYVE
ncbi:MAG: hypothetical protein JO316_22420 [Abitibacteriaceae bacterium]|nr:hypothetical protein [Abditibacteriaceae bacterium]